jgi:hypothetical protein
VFGLGCKVDKARGGVLDLVLTDAVEDLLWAAVKLLGSDCP